MCYLGKEEHSCKIRSDGGKVLENGMNKSLTISKQDQIFDERRKALYSVNGRQ